MGSEYHQKYEKLKGLIKENLRDNMTNNELIIIILAEDSNKDKMINKDFFHPSRTPIISLTATNWSVQLSMMVYKILVINKTLLNHE